MKIYLILTVFFIYIFSYLFLLNIFNVKTKKEKKAILSLLKENKKIKLKDILVSKFSSVVEKYIELFPNIKQDIDKKIFAADIKITTEEYISNIIIITIFFFIITIISYFIIPVLAPILFVLTVLVFLREKNKINEIIKNKKELFEKELPKFVLALVSFLSTSRNLIVFFEKYKKMAHEELKNDIDIIIADIKTANTEEALSRWEKRVNSAMLSQVVRGLIRTINGDANILYFEMLANDFKNIELKRLRDEANKKVPRIKKYSMFILGNFIIFYLLVIFLEFTKGVKVLL